MEKIIRINDKEFKLKSSAYTPFAYANETGRDLMKDISYIYDLYTEINKMDDENEKNLKWLSEISGMLEMVLKITHVMIKEADNNAPSYEDWLKSLDNILEDTTWLMDSLTCGFSPLSGQLQKNQNNQQG